MTVKAIDDRTPLLESQAGKPGYVTFPELELEGIWVRPKGFWWIETALWANVFLSGFDSTITASTYALIASEFGAANNAAWLTTAYLVTCTAFQPLYGRLSDALGRRSCFFACTAVFMAGCLGCALAPSMLSLVLMRALTGLGGGGLITMATIINSDIIPFRNRGMYQAMQNVLVGFGAISGASLGGVIAEGIGWRWCFLLQVPVSSLALLVGYVALENPIHSLISLAPGQGFWSGFRYLDISGASVLVLALVVQLVGLSFGGNEFEWSSLPVIGSLALSVVLIALFVVIEARTKAIPVIPLRLLCGWQPVAVQLSNLFSGMASYAYLFMIPLYFQAVRGESPATVGMRLIVPSLATPIGGVIAGSMMHRGYRLSYNVRMGTSMMLLGNVFALMMGDCGGRWRDVLFLVPANLGLGLTNPSLLFSFICLFEHKEQAVATSTVYLIRSMGTIYGVTLTSAVVQNTLLSRLPAALGPIEGLDEIVEKLRHSVFALSDLPPELQAAARAVYGDALRVAFFASSSFALLAFVFSWAVKSGSLRRKKCAS